MEAKLKYEYMDCWNLCFEKTLRKEEAQDCVVPDTLPDIAQMLHTGGCLLIRSKDVGAGRLKLEANIPAKLVFRAEDGSVCRMEVNVPVFLSVEDAGIAEDWLCTAQLQLLGLETQVLNPRKVLVKAEVAASLCCYAKGRMGYVVGVEEQEHIHVREQSAQLCCVSDVGEKTFALTDEQSLPSETEAGEIISCGLETFVDELRQLGSRLIVKGRVKSHLLMLSGQRILPLEASTDFSQIIECAGAENAHVQLWLTPSGVYHYISEEGGEKILRMEFHMVAQLKCVQSKTVELLADAYSNEYGLELEREQILCKKPEPGGVLRGSARGLFQLQYVSEIISCSCLCGLPRYAEDRISVPVTVRCIYSDEEGGIRSESVLTELNFEVKTPETGILQLTNPEITDCAASLLPGGVELRLSAQAQCTQLHSLSCENIKSIGFDENSPEDLSGKPSIVLLRASSQDDLWKLARENCSTVEEIIRANQLQDAETPWEKLLLIPKSL